MQLSDQENTRKRYVVLLPNNKNALSDNLHKTKLYWILCKEIKF